MLKNKFVIYIIILTIKINNSNQTFHQSSYERTILRSKFVNLLDKITFVMYISH